MRILLCEDDENLGMLTREYLQAKGYNVDLYADGESGYKAFLKGKYDICVFDIMMPKKDGFQLAQEVRTVNSEVPIIFLTAKTLKEDILEGFKIGADDYITKPFKIREVVARVEAVLRRAGNAAVARREGMTGTVVFEGLCIDTAAKRVTVDGADVALTKKEFEILLLLAGNAGRVFSRQDILSRVWDDDVYVLDRTVDVNITRLRKKIGHYGDRIRTRQGYGYSFDK